MPDEKKLVQAARELATILNVDLCFVLCGEIIGTGVRFTSGCQLPGGGKKHALLDLANTLEEIAATCRASSETIDENPKEGEIFIIPLHGFREGGPKH